jgi:UDP-2,3-diacylglucosamine hydrolase
MAGKKIYFISDFHLGMPNDQSSREREKRIVQWLESIKTDAAEIYLLGDIFDFWFEYRYVIPKGFIRLQGKLAELADGGIRIHYFTGNHDMWIFDYLPQEIGMQLYRHPVIKEIDGKKFFIGHGDGLGPGDHSYKLIKKIFACRACQRLFAWVHPRFGMALAHFWSRKSRIATGRYDMEYKGDEKEFLTVFAREQLKKHHIDYFIFGHRHLPLDVPLGNTSRYINLGDWIRFNTYAEWDGQKLTIKKFIPD